MSNITAEMTHEEYRKHCEEFFADPQYSKKNIIATVHKLDIHQFQEWFHQVGNQYNERCYPLIVNLIKKIRGSYDPRTDYDNPDPLDEGDNRAVVDSYRKINNDVFLQNLQDFPIVQEKFQELKAWREAQEHERLLHIEVDGKKFRAVAMCEVLWSGWESDNRVWVVEDEGVKKLVAGNHGLLFFTEPKFLEEKIKEYQDAIANSQGLLDLVQPQATIKRKP